MSLIDDFSTQITRGIVEKILSKALQYLSYHVKDFQWDKRVKPQRFTCPMCLTTPPTANFIPHTDYQIWCQHCNVSIGNIVDIVRITEDDKSELSNDEIFKYLGEKYGIEVITKAETEVALEFYKQNNFDMVPIARNTKAPIEKEWTVKTHKDKKEWLEWLNDKLNMGVKTGAISGITVVDIDQDTIPLEIRKFVEKVGTLSQKTKNGHHYFFRYEKDIPKTRIEEFKVDIENDGGQVVIFPSIVEDTKRDIELNEIKSMSPEFKEFLLSKVGYKRNSETNNTSVSELITKGTNLQVGEILEGNRHNVFMRLGGILRKDLNGQQTRNVLTLFNQHFCKPPLDARDFNAIVDSLDKYIDFDEKELAQKILQYLRIVEESPARDIREALGFKPAGEEKARVDKAISFLVKEQYIFKKQRMFHIIKKIEWKDTFVDEGKEIDYKMPYFHDYAVFRDGDMIVIGGGQKVGKCFGKDTEILMFNNEIKKVQDVKKHSLVMGPDGKARKVLHLIRGKELLYKIIYNDSNSYIVSENHLLSLKLRNYPKVYTISVKDFLKKDEKFRSKYHLYTASIWNGLPEFRYSFDLIPLEIGDYYGFEVDGDNLFLTSDYIVQHNSHLAINIIKRLVAQGKKPYYVNLESGNRYALISKQLGLVEGSFWNASHFSPEQVDLEKNAVTIIDWLLPQDYSETDKLFQYFAKQLVKNGGNLIIFMQLKNNGEFFAPNMVAFFPAFVCRYFYTDDEEGIEGAFQIDYMREPKTRTKKAKILCRYDRDTKEVHRLEEISQDKGGLADE